MSAKNAASSHHRPVLVFIYLTSSVSASTTGASGASLAGPTPTGMPASGWFRSNAGRSLRMRGIDVKLCRGGGQEVAHSRELLQPHGSSAVTFSPWRAVLYTL